MRYALAVAALLLSSCSTTAEQAPPPARTESPNDRLLEAMVSRVVAPLDRWLDATGVEPIPLDREAHYALILKPEDPSLCPPLVFRFRLDYAREHYGDHHHSKAEPWIVLEEKPVQYATRVVGGVRIQVRKLLLECLEQGLDDYLEAFALGTPVFCRMPTERSRIEAVRPQDIVKTR